MKNWKIHTTLGIVSVFFMLCFVTSPVQAETILKVGIGMADAGQLDPHISAKTQDKCVFGWMFNGLVRLKPGSMDLNAMEPDLAERWETSDNRLVWTFYLRKGVKFHGEYGEFTADDVVYSLQRAKDPKTSGFSSDYKQLRTRHKKPIQGRNADIMTYKPSLASTQPKAIDKTLACRAARSMRT